MGAALMRLLPWRRRGGSSGAGRISDPTTAATPMGSTGFWVFIIVYPINLGGYKTTSVNLLFIETLILKR